MTRGQIAAKRAHTLSTGALSTWTPKEGLSVTAVGSRMVLDLKVVLLEIFQLAGDFTFWFFKTKEPSERCLVSTNDKPLAV